MRLRARRLPAAREQGWDRGLVARGRSANIAEKTRLAKLYRNEVRSVGRLRYDV